MSEQDALIEAMMGVAVPEIGVRPVNDWYEAEVFFQGDRIEQSSHCRRHAVELVRMQLRIRFRGALETLLGGGVDVARLVIENARLIRENGKAVARG